MMPTANGGEVEGVVDEEENMSYPQVEALFIFLS